MIAAVHHGGAGPAWMGVLAAAHAWGCPPWAIAGGSPVRWYARWAFVARQIGLKDKQR